MVQYVSVDAMLLKYNQNSIISDSKDIGTDVMEYEAESTQEYPLANTGEWTRINLNNVYTSQMFIFESDAPVSLIFNNSGSVIENCTYIIFKGDIAYIYAQNSGSETANIKLKVIGIAGERDPVPAPVLFTTVTVTADYTTLYSNGAVLCDCTSNNITVTLPTLAFSDNGKSYIVKKIDSGANSVTVVSEDGKLIDGGPSKIWSVYNASYTFVYDGNNWSIV